MKLKLWFGWELSVSLSRWRPLHDLVPLFPNSADVFNEAHALILRHRPDLAGEFGRQYTGSIMLTRQWLDEHFPVPGGWGIRFPDNLARDLRDLLEPAE